MVTQREAGSVPGAQQTGKGWFTGSRVQTQAPTSPSPALVSQASPATPKPSPAASASIIPALGALRVQKGLPHPTLPEKTVNPGDVKVVSQGGREGISPELCLCQEQG